MVDTVDQTGAARAQFRAQIQAPQAQAPQVQGGSPLQARQIQQLPPQVRGIAQTVSQLARAPGQGFGQATQKQALMQQLLQMNKWAPAAQQTPQVQAHAARQAQGKAEVERQLAAQAAAQAEVPYNARWRNRPQSEFE